MGWFSNHHQEAEQNFQQYQQADNKAEFSHEALGGAAAFLAMREYEKHQPGGPGNHALAKEFLAAAVGFEVDRLAETKGMDFIDREKAKHAAQEKAEAMYGAQYNNGQGFGEAGGYQRGHVHHGHGGGFDRNAYEARHGGY